jgi:hypothetical protein
MGCGNGEQLWKNMMMTLRNLTGLFAACGIAALTGCGGDDEDNAKNSPAPGASGTAPSSLRARSYDLFEAGGVTTILFGDSADTYTLTRAGTTNTQEIGTYTPSKNGSDTWDLILNNASNGSDSRLILTFTSNDAGNFAYTPAGGALITGGFQASGSSGNNTPGNNTGTNTNGTTNTGGPAPTAAPPRLSQIVLNGKAGNPAGGGQTVINFSGTSFSYVGGGFSGSALYTPSGNSARLKLTYGGTATGDIDDYTLQFMAPSGSPTPSTFSGTQKVGSAAPAPASGTFTYTQ